MHSASLAVFHVAMLLALLAANATSAKETQLFNGKDLTGWTFYPAEKDDPKKAENPWFVQRGMLISAGTNSGYLIHATEFEDYVLTFEIRTMSTEEGNGMAVGSLDSVYINAAPEEGAFRSPKSIEISLRDPGDVFFRDIDREKMHDSDSWVFSAPDFADDVDRDMGEWNRVKCISSGSRLTVVMNDQIVNQVDPVNRTKGALAIRSSRGFVAAPTFYRNLVVRPITPADRAIETKATARLARVRAEIAQRRAAEEAARVAEIRMQEETQKKLSKAWTDVQVEQDIDFKADVRQLPYPKQVREIEFRAVFGMVEFESPQSLAQLSKFYSTEMARRGWQVTETEVEDDEVTVVFKHGKAEVELNLDESSDGVDVSLDCDELSFEGTSDPASLVKQGVPQPKAYLFLQSELKAPEGFRDEYYEDGDSRAFKSTLKLPQLYEFLTKQLRQKGYRETRRPIVNSDRRYSEFSKGGTEVSVNTFSHEIGSRVMLTYERD